VAALRDAASALGVVTQPPSADGVADLVFRAADGSLIPLVVKAAALPTASLVHELAGRAGTTVVVGDRIPSATRQLLNEQRIAWLDRRGHLRMVAGPFHIDADVPPVERHVSPRTSRFSLAGRSGLAAAAALLVAPEDPPGVSEIARRADLNPSSISRAMSSLVDAQLAERAARGRFRPLVPELFWALADAWPDERTVVPLRLADLSAASSIMSSTRVDQRGWALAGERGAVAWGAPLVLTADYPAVIYAPDHEEMRRVIATAPSSRSKADRDVPVSVAVDPIGFATAPRYRRDRVAVPLAHPLFCALDLTKASRDREALEQWEPPEGFVRVW
jgi:hypothetical protein